MISKVIGGKKFVVGGLEVLFDHFTDEQMDGFIDMLENASDEEIEEEIKKTESTIEITKCSERDDDLSEEEQKELDKMIEEYFEYSKPIKDGEQ